jgi:hypothetical protein
MYLYSSLADTQVPGTQVRVQEHTPGLLSQVQYTSIGNYTVLLPVVQITVFDKRVTYFKSFISLPRRILFPKIKIVLTRRTKIAREYNAVLVQVEIVQTDNFSSNIKKGQSSNNNMGRPI